MLNFLGLLISPLAGQAVTFLSKKVTKTSSLYRIGTMSHPSCYCQSTKATLFVAVGNVQELFFNTDYLMKGLYKQWYFLLNYKKYH